MTKGGYEAAQNMLGNIYLSGDGVIVNYQKALKWYRLSAKSGYSEGQFNLGWMYYYGRGITKNNSLAAMWIQRAADQGNMKAITFMKTNRLERFL
ncbi:sel1 repeat family protein [bacterium]|nr:sel1 repeat family protein [bacterium]